MNFSGKWQMSLWPKSTHSTRISGSVQVEDVSDLVPMEGELSVFFPLGFELAVKFTDSRGERFIIKARTGPMVNFFARDIFLEGALHQRERKIGKVSLQVDWSLVKKALPSLA